MVAAVSRPQPVSRTSSSSSIDFSANAFNAAESRRTRKRITAVQLAHLEQLYRQSSHPTRDERDALAKRIQMETKSVTIWFQNKRQTDRKVALHNATNSGNELLAPGTALAPPNITLTAPTSPAYPAVPLSAEAAARRHSNDSVTRKQPVTTRSTAFKRSLSFASSTSTTSTTSTSKTRPSLDRVASRSEIRFTHRSPLSRSTSGSAAIARTSSTSTFTRTTSTPVARTGSNSAPLPLNKTTSTASLSSNHTNTPPASPSPSVSHPLWATMLSSPLAPTSPPPAEYAAYTHARKARTLEWACLAASGPESPSDGDPKATSKIWPSTLYMLKPAFPAHVQDTAAGARAREYEEATAMTEDEAELVTPHGSQDADMPWAKEGATSRPTKANKHSRIIHIKDTMDAMTQTYEMAHMDEMAIDMDNTIPVNKRGWEEDEMHAALALCGLRG